MFPTDVVIVGGARTPMARYTGSFSDVSAIELGAHASKAALLRSGVDPAEIDHVIFGNVLQTSSDAIYGARHVGLKAGLKVETPAVTVNRLCGTGIESIAQAAQRLLLGEATIVFAGGMENMTQAPFVIRGARTGLKLGGGVLEDFLFVGLTDTYCGLPMALTAEKLAKQTGITRTDSDAYALRSQQAADAAFKAGHYKEEILPVEVKQGKRDRLVSEDDHRRPETTLETLEKLPPSFQKTEWSRLETRAASSTAQRLSLSREKHRQGPRMETDRTHCFLGGRESIPASWGSARCRPRVKRCNWPA